MSVLLEVRFVEGEQVDIIAVVVVVVVVLWYILMLVV